MGPVARRIAEIDAELLGNSDPRRAAHLVLERASLRSKAERLTNLTANITASGESSSATTGDIAAGSIYKDNVFEDDGAWRELVVRALADLQLRVEAVRGELQLQLAALAAEQQRRRDEQQQRSDEMMAALRSAVSRALAGVDIRIDAIADGLTRDAEQRRERQAHIDRRDRVIVALLIFLAALGVAMLLVQIAL